jgi:hypothetical protein
MVELSLPTLTLIVAITLKHLKSLGVTGVMNELESEVEWSHGVLSCRIKLTGLNSRVLNSGLKALMIIISFKLKRKSTMVKSSPDQVTFTCRYPGCGKRLTYNSLFIHFKRTHSDKKWIWKKAQRPLRGPVKVICPRCDKGFGTKGSLKSHVYLKHTHQPKCGTRAKPEAGSRLENVSKLDS